MESLIAHVSLWEVKPHIYRFMVSHENIGVSCWKGESPVGRGGRVVLTNYEWGDPLHSREVVPLAGKSPHDLEAVITLVWRTFFFFFIFSSRSCNLRPFHCFPEKSERCRGSEYSCTCLRRTVACTRVCSACVFAVTGFHVHRCLF